MSCATWIDGAEPTNRPNSTHCTMNFPSYCVVWDMDGKLGSKQVRKIYNYATKGN